MTVPLRIGLLCLCLLPAFAAPAQSFGDRLKAILSGSGAKLTESDAAGGIREALANGIEKAVSRLGRQDGFFADQAVKILVPKKLRKVTDTARNFGFDKQVDAFELSMNRAAESAVPKAANILGDAVRAMSMEDAIGLVKGGETAATDYFRRTSESSLRDAFLPIVAKQTASTGVTQRYKSIAGAVTDNPLSAALLGDRQRTIDLDSYVTDKAIDGLFQAIAEQEREIRANPAARTTSLLKKVFGGGK
ncbi:MAG: DUF4197 domain-containing protein [Pseudomonadales bacterium]